MFILILQISDFEELHKEQKESSFMKAYHKQLNSVSALWLLLTSVLGFLIVLSEIYLHCPVFIQDVIPHNLILQSY